VFPNDFALVNLWIDSTDFKLTDNQSIKGNTDFYSHKEGGAPALRYRILFDAHGVAREIFRPTGGGIHEANFVRLTADWFEEHPKGAVIIGDSHFSTAAKLFHDPKVLTPVHPKEKERKEEQQTCLIYYAVAILNVSKAHMH
jgi:hypothetical protein